MMHAAALLQEWHILNAAIPGFSNGGTPALQIAIRHPELVNKLIIAPLCIKGLGLKS